MKNSKYLIRDLLNEAGITLNGNKPYDIKVHNEKFYDRVLKDHALGLGESYMDGWWDAEALDQMFHRILKARLPEKVKKSKALKWHLFKAKLYNLQSPGRASQVSQQHYDLGNDFYEAMLDKRMNYTCAYWRNAENLDEAQEAKLDLVCKKLELEPGMTVLELGCGWGSFAQYAAEKYDANVTAVNISDEQVKTARQRCRDLPVKVIHGDYRQTDGQYDRVVSIGLMEHVGFKNYRNYMRLTRERLKDDHGIAFIHTIGGNYSTTIGNKWTNKYIFPNGMLPSIAQLGHAMEKQFVMEDWHNIGPHYDTTLMAWYNNFEKAWPQFRERYGDRFYRMWRYYLLSSAGGFRARDTQLWQIVLTPHGRKQPNCRIS
ncbi:MAG: cyclopropane fatty acyl phospholipid synthase [Caldithrix sp.]|nr:cyclopropane fatty acyl phospholipid synthase [Caldithrix sp.]